MSHTSLSILGALVISSAAGAQITTTTPFVGTYTEEFETLLIYPWPSCVPGRIFSNHGDACTPAGNYCVVTYGWLLYCSIYPHNASNGLFGSAQGPVQYNFDAPAQRFGGYFGTNGYAAGGIANFYDANNTLLASLPITAPNCAWAWNGWDAGSGPKFSRVDIFANDPYNGGALMQMDDMQLVPAATCSVTSYCTAGTTTHGCNALIASTGTPSASATSGFTIHVDHVEGQKSGLIFFSVDGVLAQPWGTGSSFLCIKAPTQRCPAQNSGGTVNQCDGALSIDWSAYIAAHPGALGTPYAAGDTMYAQGWFRDPSAPKATNLSNALRVVLCP